MTIGAISTRLGPVFTSGGFVDRVEAYRLGGWNILKIQCLERARTDGFRTAFRTKYAALYREEGFASQSA